DITNIASVMTNIFESAILPERETARFIRDALDSFGAKKAMMSGSGPSVFGIFDDEAAAEKAANILLDEGIPSHICKPYYPAK
ncbi:MAG: 4-(cytidine 5'-diphospho)-2-C-methyl-D-erythritol kinase, partial [Clostridia bacterium]|nr:4-(cytidine 5'-diphospho)-2-C-methyl-D-erythritol kinase [Clostridia bacterium]